jgi:hypothetical protein
LRTGDRVTNPQSEMFLSTGAWIVGIRLRLGMSGRGVAATARVRLAGSVRKARAQVDLSLADLFHQVRHEQRCRKRQGNENPGAHIGVLPSHK